MINRNYKAKDFIIHFTISILFIILLTFLTGLIVNVESPIFNNIDNNNDWIGYFGNVLGGILGALVAIIIFKVQTDKEKYKENTREYEFLLFFKNSHLNQLKKNLEIYKIQTTTGIEKYEEDNSTFPLMPMLNLNENFYDENIYNIAQKGSISLEVSESYNYLITQIQFVNQIRKTNLEESMLFLKANNDYMVQKTSKHFINRLMIDQESFVTYVNRNNLKWKNNLTVVIDIIENSIEIIEKIQNELKI